MSVNVIVIKEIMAVVSFHDSPVVTVGFVRA